MSAPFNPKVDVALCPKDAVLAVVVPPKKVVEDAFVAWKFAKAAVPVKVGDAENTTLPVPVSSVNSAASSAEVSMEVLDTLLLNTVQSADAR